LNPIEADRLTRRFGKTVADDAKTPVPDAPPAGAGPDLALNGQSPSGDAAAVVIDKPAAAPTAQAPPLYARPWFLVTVGAVLVASTIAIWALSRTPEPPGTALGNQSVF